MNIWAWVRQTQARLAAGDARAQRLRELIDELPSAAVNEAHEQVDALVPEALALARELDEPWLEVFVRHWNLQSRVLHRRQAGEELREAVDLLDFANRPRTSACPQSVCAVQDVAVCYAIRDGPGYVPERLAVARETLARIDPSWACFDCITGEYVSALLDDGRPAEALEFIDQQRDRAAEHGDFDPGFNSRLNRARALRELERARDAMHELEGIARPERYGSSRQMSHRQARTATLLALGRAQEAHALHPPLQAVIETGAHLREWVDNQVALIAAGQLPNDAAQGRELLRVQRRFEANDAYWDSARTALIAARLAHERGALALARLHLEDAQPWLTKLRRGQVLRGQHAALVAALASPRSADEAREGPEPSRDPLGAAEARLELLALEAAPARDEPGLRELERASALRVLGWSTRARQLLEQACTTLEGDALERARLELAAALLADKLHDALDELVARQSQREPSGISLGLRWVLGQSLLERRALERALELDLDTLAHAPSALRFRLRLAATARALGRWQQALDALELAARALPPGEIDWDRMSAATVLGRWDVVRSAAARLELELPGASDEEIELDMGVIRCEFVERNGARERFWALRTSPCAARVVEIAMPHETQHFRDRVVFEPRNLDAHLREQGSRPPCYEVIAVTKPGQTRAFLLRGHDPGHEQLELLRARVSERGWGFERISAVGRTAPDPRAGEGGRERATLGLLIAIDVQERPEALRELIAACCADWPLPLLSPALDRAAKDEQGACAAEALLERWRP